MIVQEHCTVLACIIVQNHKFVSGAMVHLPLKVCNYLNISTMATSNRHYLPNPPPDRHDTRGSAQQQQQQFPAPPTQQQIPSAVRQHGRKRIRGAKGGHHIDGRGERSTA